MNPGQGRLLANIVLFGRLLRRAGLDVTPEHGATFALSLRFAGVDRRDDFRRAARAVYVHRREHLAAFEELFAAFWRAPADPRAPRPELGEMLRRAPRRLESSAVALRSAADAEGARDTEEPVVERVFTYSAAEILRHKDFARLTAAEEAAVRRLLRDLVLEVEPRRRRRLLPARGGALIDLRRSFRRSLRFGGEPLELAYREHKRQSRPLVVLCDVSASMEVYSRLLLQFVYAVGRRAERLEAFAFGTRLTRITRQLRHRDVNQALVEAAEKVVDWGGGTRIGAALKTFNYEWARRVLGRGAVVAIISDGWDRGDVELLRREMGRLRRSASRVLWLNPLLGSPGYEPLTRGIQAALPLVDDFLPVHNLRSLEQLAQLLGRLGTTRRGPPAARRPSLA